MPKCCVSFCPNSLRQSAGVAMFVFPKDANLREKWLRAVKVDSSIIGENIRVCSLHFLEDDIFTFATKKSLKRGRIPHVNLHVENNQQSTEVIEDEQEQEECPSVSNSPKFQSTNKMDLNVKSKTVCRICLEINNEEIEWIFKPIYNTEDSTGELVKYSEMIMSFAAVNVILSDGLPEQICLNCAQETIKTYAFKRKCEESDKYLRNRLEDRPDSMLIDKIEIDEEDVVDQIIKSETAEECDLIDNCNQQSEVKFALKEDNFTTNNSLSSIPEISSPKKTTTTDDGVLNGEKKETVPDRIKTSEEKVDSLKQTQRNEVATSAMSKKRHSENRINHERVHTDNNKLFECTICKKKFTTASALKKHRRIHTGEKPFECDVCKQRFTQLGTLINHKRIHTGERPYKCDVCAKTFAQSYNLSVHKLTHTGKKPFVCDICKLKFYRLSDLKVHNRKHTGERTYECDICKKSFVHLSTLINHKPIHADDKPFKCDVCAKTFTRSSTLVVHKRTHTGEKPFKCDVCDKAFTQSFNLIVHKRIHTGEKLTKSQEN